VQKRLFDLCCSMTLLFLLWPLLVLIALLVKCTSRGPAIFKQKRVGHGGKLFTIFKFRTMRVESEELHDVVTDQTDLRITPFGKRLRASHLDELPQLINVLCGDMGMVGPRPLTTQTAMMRAQEVPNYHKRFESLPGITGLTQLRGRTKNLAKGAKSAHLLDLYYIRHQCLSLDLKILFRTVGAITNRAGI